MASKPYPSLPLDVFLRDADGLLRTAENSAETEEG